MAAAAGPARRLGAHCVSEPRRGANCGGRPLPSPSPSDLLPLLSLPASRLPPLRPPLNHVTAEPQPRRAALAGSQLGKGAGRSALQAQGTLGGQHRSGDPPGLRRAET